MKNTLGFASTGILIAVIGLLILGGGAYYITNQPLTQNENKNPESQLHESSNEQEREVPDNESPKLPESPVTSVDSQERSVFVSSNPYYAIDAENIYYQDEVLPIADPTSFKVVTPYSGYAHGDDVGSVYAYDSKNYYKNAEVIGSRANPNIRVFADKYILVGNELMGLGYSSQGVGRVAVENPSSLKYLGVTFFADDKNVYSMAWPDNCSGISCETIKSFIDSIAPSDFKVVAMTGWEHPDFRNKEIYGGYYHYSKGAHYAPREPSPRYIVVGNDVYTFFSTAFGTDTTIQKIDGADANTFAYVGGDYAKDKDNVYYFGGILGTNLSTILAEANPSDFKIYYPNPEDKFYLGVDSDSVYYKSKLLEGIDPKTMVIEKGTTIIKDNDTIWFGSGNCSFRDFRQGDFSEIETYRPPC